MFSLKRQHMAEIKNTKEMLLSIQHKDNFSNKDVSAHSSSKGNTLRKVCMLKLEISIQPTFLGPLNILSHSFEVFSPSSNLPLI